MYDHPFLWGSKRTGPDLHRVGGKYPHSWHYNHMLDPRSMSPGSIMPPYPWLFTNALDTSHTKKKLEVMIDLGVPYEQEYVDNYAFYLKQQQDAIAGELREQMEGVDIKSDDEIVALIAYLQRLGVDIKARNTELAEE